jgi:hypothetical protein
LQAIEEESKNYDFSRRSKVTGQMLSEFFNKVFIRLRKYMCVSEMKAQLVVRLLNPE